MSKQKYHSEPHKARCNYCQNVQYWWYFIDRRRHSRVDVALSIDIANMFYYWSFEQTSFDVYLLIRLRLVSTGYVSAAFPTGRLIWIKTLDRLNLWTISCHWFIPGYYFEMKNIFEVITTINTSSLIHRI